MCLSTLSHPQALLGTWARAAARAGKSGGQRGKGAGGRGLSAVAVQWMHVCGQLAQCVQDYISTHMCFGLLPLSSRQ